MVFAPNTQGLGMIALAASFDRRRTQPWPRRPPADPGRFAPPVQVGAFCRPALETRLGSLGWLVIASCSNACVLLMPVNAAGPPDSLEVAQATTAPAKGAKGKTLPQAFRMEEFLDRLMAAESGGRLDAKNPRSTALGPFQFIESTFLFVVNKYFQSEVASLTREQVLALRTDMAFSRRAASAYSNHLISALKREGLPASTVNVRLAFLVGADAAVRLLKAPPDQPLNEALSADASGANPYMSGATIGNLVQKAATDMGATAATRRLGVLRDEPAAAAVVVTGEPAATAAALKREASATTPAKPPFQIKCEIGLASCRKWIALQERKARLLVRSAKW